MNTIKALRILLVAFVVALALVNTACNARVGVGVSIPIGGGWRGPYGGCQSDDGVGVQRGAFSRGAPCPPDASDTLAVACGRERGLD